MGTSPGTGVLKPLLCHPLASLNISPSCPHRPRSLPSQLSPSSLIPRCSPSSILEAREFEWESQLRFYWDREPDELNIRQCTGTFGYGYEYMGLNGRLVITPLTDRIYLTLTQVTGGLALVGVIRLESCAFSLGVTIVTVMLYCVEWTSQVAQW